MRTTFIFILTLLLLYACAKNVGVNPDLAYSDAAMLDSIYTDGAYNYYKNDPTTILSGTHGPHGPFKLRFNKTAFSALTDNGKLPTGRGMPDGSLVIKEVKGNSVTTLFAFMYKKKGSWLWGEIEPDGNVHYSVKKDPSTCISCHSQTGNRDLIDAFYFY